MDAKYNSTCVEQNPPLPARKQNISQLVLAKPIPC